MNLFFLLIPFVLVVPAYAEVGRNFDTVDLGNDITQWTSHYERVFDGDSWENYILTNDANIIKFESSGISFVFDKSSCDFKLYNPETQIMAVDSYKFDLTVDAVPRPTSSCDVINLVQSEDDISFIIDRTEFQTLFELEPTSGLEWTHELDNTEGKESTFTITETCTDCNPISIDGNKIDFGIYTLDTKNNIHGTVKNTGSNKGDYIIEFEKTISDNEKLIIDPQVTLTTTNDKSPRDNGAGDVCQDTGAGSYTLFNDVNGYSVTAAIASAEDCYRAYTEFDISSIPDSAIPTDVDLKININLIHSDISHRFYGMTDFQPSTRTAAQAFDEIDDETLYLTQSGFGVALTTIDLGTLADSDLGSHLDSGTDWYAIGVRPDDETLAAAIRGMQWDSSSGGTPPQLIVTYITTKLYAVTDLTASDIRPTGVDLTWTAPFVLNTTITGYQINSTTPWGTPSTILLPNPAPNLTAFTISDLTGETQYSFRVTAVTSHGVKNATGNILDITTDFDPTEAFTVGSFNLTQVGEDTRPMVFERDDINNTALFLNVTYDDTVDLACDLHYKFANTDDTYTIFTNTSAGSGRVESPMLFLDVDNEIINVDCYDEDGSNATGRYLITQTAFPLLEHIALFREGEYGTSGDFGVLDFITMVAIIISMVGLNRVNESVGVIFSIMIIGGLAVFGIIEWPTIMTASIVLIAMVIIASTRKE